MNDELCRLVAGRINRSRVRYDTTELFDDYSSIVVILNAGV